MDLVEVKLTKTQFEKDEAKRCGSTVEAQRKQGLKAYRCECGDKTCRGWVMLPPWLARNCRELGQLDENDIFEPGGRKFQR